MPTRFWHPFAEMGSVAESELVIERGEDVWVFDEQGNRLLDATASLWYANVGHGRKEIADAVIAQMGRIEAYSAFGDFVTRSTLELAERLSDHAPMNDPKVFFASGGGDAVDTAAKLARRYWNEVGSPERTVLIGRTSSYHGTHGYGTSIGGIPSNKEAFGELAPGTVQIPYDSSEALAATINELGAGRVAAFFVEPVVGAGGVYPPLEGYIEEVAKICKEHDVLLVVDSVICGFGRLGTWFGIERWPVSPDMICFAKGVTSGYLPLGGVMISGGVSEPFWKPDAPAFRHGATYAGHAACCAAALANLDILEREGLIARGEEMEGDLLAAMRPLSESPLVAEVRGGVGTLAAVELDPDLLAAHPKAVAELGAAARRRGVIVRTLGTAVAVSPPLTATTEHFGIAAEALARALADLAAAHPEHA